MNNETSRGLAKPIPIIVAKDIAKNYKYDQIIIIARRTGDKGLETVTTYGITKRHCEIASKIGDFLKYKIMRWDKKQEKK